MSTKRQRRKWALEMSAALLDSDMDNFIVEDHEEGLTEDEAAKYRESVRQVANELRDKAARIVLEGVAE